MTYALLADTGPLYALADRDDDLHRQATEDAERVVSEGRSILVLNPTLCESYTLILRRLGQHYALSWQADVQSTAAMISPSSKDFSDASSLLQQYSDQPLTLFDALLATVSTRLQVPVWTYDHHFEVMRSNVWR